MGLFCSVLHVRDRTQSQVLDALNRVLESRGYAGHAVESVAAIGPAALRDSWPERDSDLHYLIAPHSGSWTTVIESHFVASLDFHAR